jgi:hypothetical protein
MAFGELDVNYDSATGGVFYKDSANVVTKIGPVEVGTTAPNATPVGSAGNSRGEQWYDTTNGLLKIYNGTAFVNPVPNGSTTVVGILQLTDSISSTLTTTAATPNSVKTAYDLANAAIAKSIVTAKGDLIAATASATVAALPIGTNGQLLAANSACSTGMQWCTLPPTFCGYTCSATPFNTALGGNAGDSITSAINNTAVGYNAGTANLTGNNNTFVGFAAGDATTSDNNTALGANALGGGGVNNNTAVGYNSGCSLTTGGSNTFVGAAAGDNVTTADNTVAVGYNSLGAAHTANGTVAIGVNALAVNTSGAGNTAVGFNAATAITTGANNTILGFSAGDTISTGTQNTFVGACSGGTLAGTSEGNTGIGFSALGQGVTSGAYNVAVGTNAGLAVTSGALNTLVGYTAGSAITTGGSNTLVGRYIGTAALANNVVLSDGAGTIRFQSNSTGAISLGAGGSYGTAGQILVSGGSGAAPAWTTSASVPANYGSFLRTTTQTNTGGATGQAVIFDTTVASNNFSLVSGTQVTAAIAGTYTIVATYQVSKTNAGSDDVNVWFKKNGVNIPNSAFNLTLVGNNAAQLATTPWIITLAAGDQIEAWWWSADANAILLAEPAAAPYPAIPAINLVIMPVGA